MRMCACICAYDVYCSILLPLPFPPLPSVGTPEAVRHIQRSFKEASQKRVLDQATSDDPLAFCSQLLHPSESSSRSKIPTKVADTQAKRASKKGPAATHVSPKVATHTTARKKKAAVKHYNSEHTSSTSVEGTSVTAKSQVVDSSFNGATPPSKGPLSSSVSYNFLDMSLAGAHFGISTTASPHTKETQLPLTTPHHPHPPSVGGDETLSERNGALLPQQTDGTSQDHCTPHKTSVLPKAYDILADEIVSAMVSAHGKGQKGSTGRSSRHQTPEVHTSMHTRTHTHTHIHARTHTHVMQTHTNARTHRHTHRMQSLSHTYLALQLHGVADPVSALETDAFTTKDKLERTPPASSQHQQPISMSTMPCHTHPCPDWTLPTYVCSCVEQCCVLHGGSISACN